MTCVIHSLVILKLIYGLISYKPRVLCSKFKLNTWPLSHIDNVYLCSFHVQNPSRQFATGLSVSTFRGLVLQFFFHVRVRQIWLDSNFVKFLFSIKFNIARRDRVPSPANLNNETASPGRTLLKHERTKDVVDEKSGS